MFDKSYSAETMMRLATLLTLISAWIVTSCGGDDTSANGGASGMGGTGTLESPGSGGQLRGTTGGAGSMTDGSADGEDASVAGFVGSCTFVTAAGVSLCTDYSDCSESASTLEQSCARSTLAFSASPCPRTDIVGTCSLDGSVSLCATVLYYPNIAGDPALSVENGQHACIQQNGQWAANP